MRLLALLFVAAAVAGCGEVWNDPYPAAEVKQVKFLVYNEAGETVFVGEGVSSADGAYTLTIPADTTGALTAGTGRIEAAVIVLPVAVPTFSSVDYVVVP